MVSRKIKRNIGAISKIRYFVDSNILNDLYFSLVYPFLLHEQVPCGGVYTGLKTQHQLYVGLWALPQASGTSD